MKRLYYIFILFCFICLSANAGSISSFINDTDFEHDSTVSIYVKNNQNNEVVYSRNKNKLLNPASVLKLLTFGASYKVLGSDYEFETVVYKDAKNNLYIKLGGDPLLAYLNLEKLMFDAKQNIDVLKINGIYIDDTIFDKTPYPDSWMQEDAWPYQRAITQYIIDKNYTEIAIKRSSLATKVDIIQNSEYKLPVINELTLGQKQDYKISREYGENSPIVTFRGTINNDEIKKIPVLNPQVNFVVKLNKALKKNGYLYDRKIQFAKTPSAVTRIASFSHNINEVSKGILLGSDNFASEVVSKVAASKYIGNTRPATNEDMINMFYDVYKDVITDDIIISDSCGVSRKNLLSAEFIVNALNYINSTTDIQSVMMMPNQGTLANRLLFLKDNLKAKTGTLSNMSSIAGILNSQKSNNLTFVIIVQNSAKRNAILKNFEDNIIGLIYKKY